MFSQFINIKTGNFFDCKPDKKFKRLKYVT